MSELVVPYKFVVFPKLDPNLYPELQMPFESPSGTSGTTWGSPGTPRSLAVSRCWEWTPHWSGSPTSHSITGNKQAGISPYGPMKFNSGCNFALTIASRTAMAECGACRLVLTDCWQCRGGLTWLTGCQAQSARGNMVNIVIILHNCPISHNWW